MLVDTHTHVNFKPFHEDGVSVMEEVRKRGMQIIVPGSQIDTSRRAVAYAEQYPETVFACIGVHPIHIKKYPFDAPAYGQLAEHEAVVGIGEIGIDAFHLPKDAKQRRAMLAHQEEQFRAQVDFALARELPLMLHCRNAYDEELAILRTYDRTFRGQIHSFEGTIAQVDAYLALGFNVGFTGTITYPENTSIREVVEHVPLERVHIETDAPYLAPVPHRREKNFPWYVEHIARTIAEVKESTYEEVGRATAENARRVFNLPQPQ